MLIVIKGYKMKELQLVTGMPFDEYRAIKALNSSSFGTLIDESPKHLRYEADNPREATPALTFGRAVHTAILEEHLFEEQFAVRPKVDRRTKAGKAEYAEWLELNDGKEILTEEQMDTCFKIYRNVMDHPRCNKLLSHKDLLKEATIFGDWGGIPVKVRLDVLCRERKIVADVKTAESAAPDAFSRSIDKWKLMGQAAYYLDVASEALGWEEGEGRFMWIVVEKHGPCEVALYTPGEKTLQAGRAIYAKAADIYDEAVSSNNWYGYSKDVEVIDAPAYSLQRYGVL